MFRPTTAQLLLWEAAAHQANRLMSTWIEKRYAKLIDGMDTMDLRDMFSGNDIK